MTRFFLFVLPLVGCLTSAQAQIGTLTDASDEGQAVFNRLSQEDRVYPYHQLNSQPLFNARDCDTLTDHEKRVCSEMVMVNVINNHLSDKLRISNTPPLVAVMNLIIERDGSISSIQFGKSPGLEFEEAYVAAVRQLGANGPGSFIAGTVNNRPVRCEFALPIRICISNQ